MKAVALNNVEIISSVPGRIRLKLLSLLQQDFAEERVISLFENLKGIKNLSFNNRTGNTLLFYEEAILDEAKIIQHLQSNRVKKTSTENCRNSLLKEAILPTINPINYINGAFTHKAYERENSFSKALLRTGLIIGAGILLLTSMPANVVAAAILSYPAIFYTISNTATYLVSRAAEKHRICIKSIEAIKLLPRANQLIIEDNILLKADSEEFYEEGLEMESLRRAILLNNNQEPITGQGKSLIKSFRSIGITNIALATDKAYKKNALIEYLQSTYGLNRYDEEQYSKIEASKLNTSDIAAYMVHKAFPQAINEDIIVQVVSRNINLEAGDISLMRKDILKLPKLIRLSKITEEFIKRRQLTAMTINIVALFLAMLRRINPILALLIYIVNTLIQIKTLQNNIDGAKGVLFQ